MIYMDVPLDEWCKKHKLIPREMKCKKCGATNKTTVPIKLRGYVGLEIPEHGCGVKTRGAILKPVGAEVFEWLFLTGGN